MDELNFGAEDLKPELNSIRDGIRHAPGGGRALIHADDALLLLLDHQAGLFETVKDIPVTELRANVGALARLASLLKLPVVTTASVPDGPNGPSGTSHSNVHFPRK